MQSRYLTLIVLSASLSLMGHPALGQFLDEPDTTADNAATTSRPDELVRQLESKAGRGGLLRAEAIRSLARLKAWPQVDRWIGKIDAVGDDAELAESARAIGTAMLFRISMRPDLSDAARSAIQKMSAASKRVNEAPARLQSAIDQLATEDVDAVLGANRVLMSGGEASVKALVSAVGRGLPENQKTKVVALLRGLGNGGADALEQLALYGQEAVRPAALDGLMRLNFEAAHDSILTSAFAADATQSEVDVARYSGLIPADFEKLDAVATLSKRLHLLQDIAARTPNDFSAATLWSVDADRTGVDANRSTSVFRSYRDAYDASQRLRRLGSLPLEVRRQILAADMSYRLMVDVDWGTAEQIKAIRESYLDDLAVDSLLVAFAEERSKGNVPAAVGLLRLISDSMLKSDTNTWVILLREGKLSALVDGVRDSEPWIRYETTELISELLQSRGPNYSFPGSSYYRRTLSEMAKLDSRPTAILVETRPVVALRQETILRQLGYEVRQVKSALQAERELRNGGDFQLMVSKVQLSDASPAELVDRIRRRPLGDHLAIVFYSDLETNPKSVRGAEWETTSNRWISESTPAVYLVPLPGSPSALSDVLTEINSKQRLPSLSITDRERFRAVGAAALQGDSTPR